MAQEMSPEARTEAQIDTALTNAYTALREVGGSLKGGGEESHKALASLTQKAASLHTNATIVRDYLADFAADETLPADHRDKKSRDIHKAAQDRIQTDYNTLLKNDLPALEHVLGEATLPQPSKDASAESLKRQEVLNLVNGKTGADMLSTMFDTLGKDAGWDSTMLSSFGKSLFIQAGLTPNDWTQFRKAAVAKLLTSPVGTERMLANRKALIASKNLRGTVTTMYAIAQRRLGDPPKAAPGRGPVGDWQAPSGRLGG
jgi:hypothetical protein